MNYRLANYPLVLFLGAVGVWPSGDSTVVAQEDAAPAQVENLPLPQQAPATQAPAESPAQAADPFAEYDKSNVQAAGEDYKVLLQGQVHEAFAAPIDSDPTDGERLIDKAPPPPVNEQPPESTPENERTKWIPGYWGWSDDQDDYVWVSGLWRKTPPGQTWNPGSWHQTASGQYRWISGYWASDRSSPETANYLPTPPKSIDNGPSIQPPGDDYFWVPGHWEYAGNAYRWRGGFWSVQQGNWIWQPECYVSTPRGYLSVNGYWDYLPSDRGLLYSPVSFYGSVYSQPNYVYRPRYPLVDTAALLLNLFVRQGYSNYYYGDYRGSFYSSLGYRPWYDYGYGVGAPWLGYYDRKYHKSGIDFVGSMQRYDNHVRASSQSKPQIANLGRSGPGHGSHSSSAAPTLGKFGRSLDEVVRSDEGRVAITRGGDRSRGDFSKNASGLASGVSRSPDRSGSHGNQHGMSTRGNPGSSNTLTPSVGGRGAFSVSPKSGDPRQDSRSSVSRSPNGSASPGPGSPRSSGAQSPGRASSIQGSPPSTIQRGAPSTIQRSPPSAIQRSQSQPPSAPSFRSSPSIRRGPSLSSGSGPSSAPRSIQRSPSRPSSTPSLGSSRSAPRSSSPSIGGGRGSSRPAPSAGKGGGGGGGAKSGGFRGITGKK